jgi:magnesium chelatase subunit D
MQVYPFSAIVGQRELKLALILNAIDPRIGGLLVRGEKGTAKSTAVRALASVLPKLASVEGCPFGCDPADPVNLCADCQARVRNGRALTTRQGPVPLVTLPLNATEEMVVGGLDLESALRNGRRAFSPGLLARANRGILYIDEVNLLDDHIVDIILDVAASGVNLVEREGVSYWHPAQFILVGTMNPEEGALRPHFLDRFGLCVQVSGTEDVALRVAVMRRREAYDADPGAFIRAYQERDAQVAVQITNAREGIESVVFPDHLRGFVSEICVLNNVAGHRADLVIRRAAAALVAFEARWEVSVEYIERVARMALLHRRRDAAPELPPPPPEPQHDARSGEEQSTESPDEPQDEGPSPHLPSQAAPGEPVEGQEPFPLDCRERGEGATGQGEQEQVFETGVPFKVQRIDHRKDRMVRRGSGRRSRTRTVRQGRYVRSVMRNTVDDIAFDATLRAAAPKQRYRDKAPGMALSIQEQDLRQKLRERRVGDFMLFIVDASGSMGARARMVATKGAILSLLIDAYQKRDRVAMITFRRQQATVSLQPTSSVDLAVKQLQEMLVGGRTPLSHGMVEGFRLLRNHLIKEPAARPIAILVTDGKANVSLEFGRVGVEGEKVSPRQEALQIAARMAQEERIKYIVVDTEEAGVVTFGLAAQLAVQLEAEYFKIDDLKARDLVDIVTGRTISGLEER